jgi:hypothetical protein
MQNSLGQNKTSRFARICVSRMATATTFSSPPPGRRADEGETIAQLQAHFRVELHGLWEIFELELLSCHRI